MENRVTVRLENQEILKIEARIKQEYPKIKNVSELVRAALDAFLDKKSEHYACSCSNPKTPEIKKVREAQAVKAKTTQTLTIPTLRGGNAT